MGFVLATFYIVVALSPLLFIAALRMKSDMTVLFDTATGFALAAFAIIAVQPVLSSRWRWIERPFGFDVVIRFHRYMGVFAVFLLLVHPPGMAYGGLGLGLLTSLNEPWYVWGGRVVLSLLILHVIISLWYSSFGLTFEQWRRVHNVLAVLIVAGGFVHSWFAAYDLTPILMRILWLLLFALAVFAYVHHKIVKPKQLERSPYKVIGVEQETHNVWTVKFTPQDGQPIYDYQPGQFHFLTLRRSEGLPVEEHHWTISSSPANKDFISSTIKESGDFTATIGQTRVGDTALEEGPFGRFCYTFHPEDRDFVFIAGGIGITPIMSMIRHMRDTRKQANVVLLYANRTEEDIVFRCELAEIESGAQPHLKVIHVIASPKTGWSGESGHLDKDKISRLVGNREERTGYYICAPPRMVDMAIESLRSMGISYAQIRTEVFLL